MRYVLWGILFCLVGSVNRAETILLKADGSGDYPTVQAAIDATEDGDTIILMPGIYTGDGNRDIDFTGKAITIQSEDPSDPSVVAATIIDCQGTEQDPHRGFKFVNHEKHDSVLDGLTIINGYAPDSIWATHETDGGAICCWFSGPTIKNCIIAGNSAEDGGGIMGGDGRIENCFISGNMAETGGGVAIFQGQIISSRIVDNKASFKGAGLIGCHGLISQCIISNNEAEYYGGGLSTCDAIIEDCVISQNTAKDGGGLMFCDGVIENCVIRGNRASLAGGGLNHCDAPIRNCRIVGNWAGQAGGAVVCRIPVNFAISETFIGGNFAGQQGGGIYDEWSHIRPLRLTNVTLVQNVAGETGGGIMSYTGPTYMVNCIVSGNQSSEGSQMAFRYDEDPLYQGPIHIDYCNIEGGQETVYSDPNILLIWGAGNIDADPQFADPGYWDPNGTPENLLDDVFVEGDYHLKSQAGRWDSSLGQWVIDDVTSPCIDAGSMDTPIGLEPFPNGGQVNLGAYGGTGQASKSYFGAEPCTTIIAGDINGDCRVDLSDLAILTWHWLEKGQ